MKPVASSQKLRGGYYTPKPIADFLTQWAVQRCEDAVLEPSCGDGAFIEAIISRRRALGSKSDDGQVLGLELDYDEACKSARRLAEAEAPGTIITGDFFAYCRDTLWPEGLWEGLAPQFDAVVGNPPFIRYQSFPDQHRAVAFHLMRRAGLHPNKLTNAWVAFLVCGAMTLKQDGRMAMVIPAELLQVSYAAEVRRFLSTFFERITLITFRNLVFPDIQQEVILLLAERTAGESRGVRTVELGHSGDLAAFDFFQSLNGELKPLDHTAEKWTKYFLPARDIVLLRQLRTSANVVCVRDVAEIDVGVVTGENDFFILRPSEARTAGVARFTKRTVSKSGQLVGLKLSADDWSALRAGDARVLLFSPRRADFDELPAPVRSYIRNGERKNQHSGYKCRVRTPWYVVRSTWIPQAFALRQVHRFPKFVVNEVEATTTDTVHRVRFKSGVNPYHVAAAFLNSMTFAFSEIMGRSYGGGVLTFEPSEVESLPLPLAGSEELDIELIDRSLRQGDIVAVLDHTDEILLRRHLGLDTAAIVALRGAWTRLRDRRLRRRSPTHRSTAPTPSAELIGATAEAASDRVIGDADRDVSWMPHASGSALAR